MTRLRKYVTRDCLERLAFEHRGEINMYPSAGHATLRLGDWTYVAPLPARDLPEQRTGEGS